jgi:hypothetical protein
VRLQRLYTGDGWVALRGCASEFKETSACRITTVGSKRPASSFRPLIAHCSRAVWSDRTDASMGLVFLIIFTFYFLPKKLQLVIYF